MDEVKKTVMLLLEKIRESNDAHDANEWSKALANVASNDCGITNLLDREETKR